MIIQCEKCRTKFRLDDSRVTDKGVKVRCAKCRNIFTVEKERSEADSYSDFGTMLDQSTASARGDNSDPFAAQQETATPNTTPATAIIQPQHSDSPDQTFSNTSQPDSASFNTSEDDFNQNIDQATAHKPEEPVEPTTPAGDLSDFDFDFDFEDDNPFSDTPSVEAEGTTSQAKIQEPDLPDDDFNSFEFEDDNPFADDSITDQQTEYESPFSKSTVVAAEEIAAPQDELDAAAPDFTDTATTFAPASEKVQTALAAEQKPKPIIPSTPLPTISKITAFTSDDHDETTAKKAPISIPALRQEELPPLSISSRRRQNPLITGAIAVAGVLIVSAIAYFGYSMFIEGEGKIAQETGKIAIRSLDASFIKNQTAGDLLVITGEALNNFKEPRAAIQIKGIIYGANSQILGSKDAYAGNPLTKEQLASMPLDKIEAAMANQFGDSLANLEVAPGKAIPFVIVIPQPPADAKDYGVEPLGSTVATGRQQ